MQGISVLIYLSYIFVYLKFLGVQKIVQNGNLTNNYGIITVWQAFMLLGIVAILLEVLNDTYIGYLELKENVYLRVNVFKRYRKLFPIYEKSVRLKVTLIGNIFFTIEKSIYILLNLFLVIKTADMANFSISVKIGGIILLAIATVFGILKGVENANIADTDSIIKEKENDLTKFYTFSKVHSDNSLFVLQNEYEVKNKKIIVANLFSQIPYITKVFIVACCTYGMINSIVTSETYSNYYIVATIFGTILTVARLLSSVIEYAVSSIAVSKNEAILELNRFEQKEKFVISNAKEKIKFDSKSNIITINQKFTADLELPTETRYYSLCNNLHIQIGKNILITGSKGTGKTRILQIIESLYEENVMIYNDKTKVFDNFIENFKSSQNFNYELIQEIASGLKLERLKIPEKALREIKFCNLNTGDRHLLVALVMLYYAILDPSKARIIIFDELLANIDTENAIDILAYITKVGKDIGSSIIFVGHGQQEILKKYCETTWVLENLGIITTIEEKPLSND
jgi:energy-coupling factor transporter ATP-binding protein EcfA2